VVLNYLGALRRLAAAGAEPFVPGAMVCWELMVGNSNTRWHWSTVDGAAEPAIPWDAWLFPDGTPISHTEAGALRRYMTGADEFLAFEDFLGGPAAGVVDGDRTHALAPGAAGSSATMPLGPSGAAGVGSGGDDSVSGGVLAEAAFWPTRNDSVFALYARAATPRAPPTPPTPTAPTPAPPGPPAPRLGGYAAVVDGSTLTVERQAGAAGAAAAPPTVTVLARFDLSSLENGVVIGAWNMLRLLVQPGGAVKVWFNPMFPETGFQGTADDHARLPKPLPPRIAVVDADPLPPAAASFLAMAAGVSEVRVDYASALPDSVL
jgi:hypothetical protein